MKLPYSNKSESINQSILLSFSVSLFLSFFLSFLLSCVGVPVPFVPGVPASSRTFLLYFTFLPVCNRLLPTRWSYVLVCDSYVPVCYSYIVVRYSYVPVWCFSHDPFFPCINKIETLYWQSRVYVKASLNFYVYAWPFIRYLLSFTK